MGWTSFDVVKKIRSITKEKKVGHAGTLDPFAEGVLIVGTGIDTKSLSKISNTSKSYKGRLKLGEETDTIDTEGKVVSKMPIPIIDSKYIDENKTIPAPTGTRTLHFSIISLHFCGLAPLSGFRRLLPCRGW